MYRVLVGQMKKYFCAQTKYRIIFYGGVVGRAEIFSSGAELKIDFVLFPPPQFFCQTGGGDAEKPFYISKTED